MCCHILHINWENFLSKPIHRKLINPNFYYQSISIDQDEIVRLKYQYAVYMKMVIERWH